MFKRFKKLFQKKKLSKFEEFISPYFSIRPQLVPLESGSNRKLEFDFESQFRSLIYYHLMGFESGRELLQHLEDDDYCSVKMGVSPVKRSTFFEALSSRGLPQLIEVYEHLYRQCSRQLSRKIPSRLGELVSIDGSLIDTTLSMIWADYRKQDRKAKIHMGFDISEGVPKSFVITDGKQDEKQFLETLIQPGQTGVVDRYFQCYQKFDQWHAQGLYFVCRLRNNHRKTILSTSIEQVDGDIQFDGKVLLGTPNVNQTQEAYRLIAYEIEGNVFWVATNRWDLKAEDIALIYKLRWTIESFFQWWKKHLNVYHVLSRSRYGFNVQLVAGLITYLLMAIYCKALFNDKVRIDYIRQLRIAITNQKSILLRYLFMQGIHFLKWCWAFAKT